jgi:hypothetical protein
VTLQGEEIAPEHASTATKVCSNPEKKGIFAPTQIKKCLQQRAGVLFFAPIDTCAAAPRSDTTFEE